MSGLAWYLAESGAALAVFYGLFRLSLKDDTHFRATRLYLLATLVGAHVLPLAHVASPFRQAVLPRLPMRAFGEAGASQGLWDWPHLLLGVYLAGAGFVLLRLGGHLWHLLLVLRRQPVVHCDGIRLVYIEDDCPPFSFLRTAFVHRPAAGEEKLLEHVVAHERTHIRQRHSLDILLVQIVAIGQWFNPFAWLYERALREIHEYLADQGVLARGFDPPTYRRFLLEQRMGAQPFELAHHFRPSHIRRRLSMMARRSSRWSYAKYLLVAPALALLIVAFADPQVTVAEVPAERKGAMLPRESAAATRAPDFSDPAVIEELLRKVARETVALEARSVDSTDRARKEDLRQELNDLTRKRAALEARLAQLRRSG